MAGTVEKVHCPQRKKKKIMLVGGEEKKSNAVLRG